ncbi:MAG TPA: hypothetical protein VKQ07_08180, partial [Jatrophihabitantaceae bacterium]|nr:hypothetical protein [Jatrophihabitantaceae bacterium]
ALKPWYARRLRRIVARLDAQHITANAVSATGVLFAGCAGAVIAFAPTGLISAGLVAAFLAARLACANMDGTLARRQAPRAFGGVVNELGDRLADFALLAGLWPHLGWATSCVLLAAMLPSWASLAVAAHGAPRPNGGPMGKTERCLLGIVAVASGWYAPIALAIVVGSVATAIVRLSIGSRALATGARS